MAEASGRREVFQLRYLATIPTQPGERVATPETSTNPPADAPPDLAALFARAQRVFEGRFALERTVAASETRVLFVAKDVALKRRVALRIHLKPDSRSRLWFERETELLAAVDHRAIRPVYGGGYEGNWAYRIAKWIEGESLEDAVSRGPRSIPFILQLARDLTSALEYAHSKQIVLRRIIPATVMLDETQRGVITDFRFANQHLDLADPDQDGSAAAYLAPETWHGHLGDPASDIYTLGALLYFTLTGQPPATNPKDIRPPSELRANSPQIFDRILLRALQYDPVERYLNAADMAEDLASELGEFELPVAMPAPRSSREDRDAWEKQLRRALGDQYELMEELGQGGFGSVYRVRDLGLEREVALKVLHPLLTTDTSVVDRFRKEAQLAAQLDHPNIVSIFGIGSRAGLLWYTMEYIAGLNLAQLIRQQGPMPLSKWTVMMGQALGALHHAHNHGVVHRDLKPENILIDAADGSVQITDFGLAIALHGGHHTSTASHSGTPEFAAPEQMLNEPVDHRADLYALSAVGFFALTGRPPIEGATVEAVLARKATGDLPLVRHFRQDIPDDLLDALVKGAQRDPADRFASAQEYARAIRSAARPAEDGLRARLRGFFGRR